MQAVQAKEGAVQPRAHQGDVVGGHLQFEAILGQLVPPVFGKQEHFDGIQQFGCGVQQFLLGSEGTQVRNEGRKGFQRLFGPVHQRFGTDDADGNHGLPVGERFVHGLLLLMRKRDHLKKTINRLVYKINHFV